MTKRKYSECGRLVFNFYKSYFDVFCNLDSDADKLQFITAVLDRQFLGKEPVKLSKMANFAYISQKHNIDTQVKGFEDKIGRSINEINPTVGGTVGGTLGGTVGGTVPPRVQSQSEPQPQPESETQTESQEAKKNSPPPLSDFLEYCKTITQFSFLEYEYSLKSKYQQWLDDGWKDGHGKKIKNWKNKIQNTYPFLPKTKPQKQANKYIPTIKDKW